MTDRRSLLDRDVAVFDDSGEVDWEELELNEIALTNNVRGTTERMQLSPDDLVFEGLFTVKPCVERIEKAVRGAILAGYDGVDVNYQEPWLISHEVKPWNRPAPDPANGYHSVRYTWDWFDNDQLEEIARTGDIPESMQESGLDD